MKRKRYPNRDAWLAARRQRFLGASEDAAALGEDPWRSKYTLWAHKTDQLPPTEQTEPMKWGLRLEGVIVEAFGEEYARDVQREPAFTTRIHPDHPFLCASLDAIQFRGRNERHLPAGPGVLQIKTASEWNRKAWEHDAPLHYQIQTQMEMEVSGCAWGSLGVLIGGNKMRRLDYVRNDRFITRVLPELKHFWFEHVVAKVPPRVDGSESTRRTIELLHPLDSGDTVELDSGLQQVADELEEVKAAKKEAVERERALENQLKAAIGDNTFGVLPNGQAFTYKTQTRAAHEVKESTFRVLRRKQANGKA